MVKIIKILEREIIYGMQLLGVTTVNDLVPGMVGCPRSTISDDRTRLTTFRQVERVDWQPILPALSKL